MIMIVIMIIIVIMTLIMIINNNNDDNNNKNILIVNMQEIVVKPGRPRLLSSTIHPTKYINTIHSSSKSY